MEIFENLDLNNLENEVWKDIKDYEGDYQISNFGRVKSFKKYKNGKIRKQSKSIHGYFHLDLYKNGKYKTKFIHILMYETFNNYKLKDNECIHHIDFTKNNYLDNFQLMTKSEHMKLHMNNENNHNIGIIRTKETIIKMSEIMKEKYKNGELKILNGENNPNSKLKEKQIIQIHMLHKLGFKNKEIEEKLNIPFKNISRILKGYRWNYIYKQFYKEVI